MTYLVEARHFGLWHQMKTFSTKLEAMEYSERIAGIWPQGVRIVEVTE
jgi:hypothetical protein